jgi:hypothetical protein
MRDKYKAAQANRFASQLGVNLNPESFYEEHGIKERWQRLQQSIEEVRSFWGMSQNLQMMKE